jgi:hypothetical protein
MYEISPAPEYALGDRVWHRGGDEALGVVTGYIIRPTGLIYCVSWHPTCDSNHFGHELAPHSERPDYPEDDPDEAWKAPK